MLALYGGLLRVRRLMGNWLAQGRTEPESDMPISDSELDFAFTVHPPTSIVADGQVYYEMNNLDVSLQTGLVRAALQRSASLERSDYVKCYVAKSERKGFVGLHVFGPSYTSTDRKKYVRCFQCMFSQLLELAEEKQIRHLVVPCYVLNAPSSDPEKKTFPMLVFHSIASRVRERQFHNLRHITFASEDYKEVWLYLLHVETFFARDLIRSITGFRWDWDMKRPVDQELVRPLRTPDEERADRVPNIASNNNT